MDRSGTGIDLVSKDVRRAHLVGLEAAGMPALAQVLVQRGCVVSGTVDRPDAATEHLRSLGIKVHAGHSPASSARSAPLLIHGRQVPREHPERLGATRRGVEQASYPEVVERLMAGGLGIAAVGGRRASVAAAMIGWTLAHAGLDPTVLLARPSQQLGGRGRFGLGPHVVVEADDAAGVAPSAEVVAIFEPDRQPGWAEGRPGLRHVLAMATRPPDDEPAGTGSALVERFSLLPGHAWWGADLREARGRYRFRAFHRGRFAVEIGLQVPGRHHVLGALATVAVCTRVDVSTRAIKEALEEFDGVSRGFESRGSYRGVTLVDDEASGPDAAGEAVELARQVFGRRKIRVVYRPDPLGDGSWPRPAEFRGAEHVLVVDETGPSNGSMAWALESALRGAGTRTARASQLDEAIRELDRHLEPGDVLVTLGAGDVGTIADAFLRRLSRDRHAR